MSQHVITAHRCHRVNDNAQWPAFAAGLLYGALLVIILLPLAVTCSERVRAALFNMVFEPRLLTRNVGAFFKTCDALTRMCPNEWALRGK